MIRLWRKLRAAALADRALAVEALVLLLAARLVLWCLPFASSRRLLSRWARRAHSPAIPVERAAWALTAVSRRLPEPLRDCLPQALAAEALLRRHGAPADMRIGMRRRSTGPGWEAHAWVVSGQRVVIGLLEDLPTYAPLTPGRATPASMAWTPGLTRESLAALIRDPHATWARVACDPDSFTDRCRAEGILPLLYQRMRDSPAFATWPGVVRDALEHDAREAAAREMLVRRELIRVLAALAARGVQPVLFKGTALAYSRYPQPSLRARSDTDVLIRRDDTPVVQEALSALGYASSLLCDGELVFRQFEMTRTDEFGVPHALDVHWAISTQAAFAEVLPYEELASRAVPVPALGPSARVPATVDALLLALIHPVMHHRNEQRLLWAYDVHLLAEALDPQGYEDLVARSVERRVAAVCVHGLRVARELFGTAVPQPVLDRLASVPVEGQPTAAYLAGGRTWTSETVANVRGLPRWADRLRLLKEIAFPAPAYMLHAYRVAGSGLGRALLPALYLHRGVRGVWRVVNHRK